MERFVDVDGVRTRYLERGAGPALVLLHGISLGSSADVWEEDLAPLARAGFRVLAYDQPGFGLTETGDFTEAYQRGFVLRFMDALGIVRASLVGHSFSGQLVVRLALDHPERVERVVVVGTISLLPPLAGEEASRDRGSATPSTRESVRKLLESQLCHKELITSEVVEQRYRMSTGHNFEAFLERRQVRQHESEGLPLWQRLKEIPVPLLMLYGSHDRKGTPEKCALLREQAPGLRIELIDNAGHLLMWDAPELFGKKVLEFLAG